MYIKIWIPGDLTVTWSWEPADPLASIDHGLCHSPVSRAILLTHLLNKHWPPTSYQACVSGAGDTAMNECPALLFNVVRRKVKYFYYVSFAHAKNGKTKEMRAKSSLSTSFT